MSNEKRTIPKWQQGGYGRIGMGSLVTFRQHAQDVPGLVIGIAQTGKHRGKWAVRNETTGRIVYRTERALKARHA